MKKSLLLVAPLLLGMLLTSCGEPSSSEAPQSTDAPASSDVTSSDTTPVTPTEKVRIEFWSTIGGDRQYLINEIAEEFMVENPEIEVVPVYKGGDYDQLKEAVNQGFSANNYPDIVQCYPDHVAEYIYNEKEVDLDPYIHNEEYGLTDEEFADYVPAFVEEGQKYSLPGTYSMPFCKSTEAMFYNEKLIDAKLILPGINEGKVIDADYLNNLTWEELWRFCDAFTVQQATLPEADRLLKADPKGAIFGYDSDDNLFITLAEQYKLPYTEINPINGKGEALFNTPGMQKVVKSFVTAYKNKYITTKGVYGNYLSNLFQSQKILFNVGSTGGISHLQKNGVKIGVAKIPHAEGKDPKAISQGPSLCVLDHGSDARKVASWKFYKYLTNKENSLAWSLLTNYSPIRQSVYAEQEWLDACDPTSKEGEDTLEALQAKTNYYTGKIKNTYFASPAFNGSSSCRKAAGSIITQCLKETTELKDEALDAKIDEIFNTNVNEAMKDIF